MLSSRKILKDTAVNDARVSLPLRAPSSTVVRPLCDEATFRKELETECQELRERAREEGFQQGYQEGVTRANAEAAEIRRMAGEVLEQARAIQRETVANLEPEILRLACTIAERLVSAQLTLEEAMVVSIAREAVEQARGKRRLNILANVDDAGHMRENLHLFFDMAPGSEVNIIEDHEMPRGACKVDTEEGLIDASWDIRWQGIRKALGL